MFFVPYILKAALTEMGELNIRRILTHNEKAAAYDILDAPIKRVCAPDTPVPFSPVLEDFWMPDEDNLIKAITEII